MNDLSNALVELKPNIVWKNPGCCRCQYIQMCSAHVGEQNKGIAAVRGRDNKSIWVELRT